jgi:hypothetical protein
MYEMMTVSVNSQAAVRRQLSGSSFYLVFYDFITDAVLIVQDIGRASMQCKVNVLSR